MKLTAKRVEEIFMDCFPEDSNREKAVIVEGILNNFGFDYLKLEKYKSEICELLNELPTQFQEESGGGWSFLQACMTKDNHQWGRT